MTVSKNPYVKTRASVLGKVHVSVASPPGYSSEAFKHLCREHVTLTNHVENEAVTCKRCIAIIEVMAPELKAWLPAPEKANV